MLGAKKIELLPTFKPGQTEENTKKKFDVWGAQSAGYYPKMPRDAPFLTYQTDNKSNNEYAEEPAIFKTSFEINKSLRLSQQMPALSAKHQITFEFSPEDALIIPSLMKSNSKSSFNDIVSMNKTFQNYSADDFKPVFDQIVMKNGYEDNSITVKDVVHIVLATLGSHSSQYILDKFKKLASDIAVYRRYEHKIFHISC